MLQARGKGIVLWTLRYGDEVRDPKEVFGDVEEKKAEPKLVTLVQKLIDDLQAPWDPALLADPVQERLQDIIAGKQKKKPKTAASLATQPATKEPCNVASTMTAPTNPHTKTNTQHK